MGNIVIGIIFIIGGLSGQLVLIGTQSSEALAAVGVVLVIWGIVQMTRKKNDAAPLRRPMPPPAPRPQTGSNEPPPHP